MKGPSNRAQEQGAAARGLSLLRAVAREARVHVFDLGGELRTRGHVLRLRLARRRRVADSPRPYLESQLRHSLARRHVAPASRTERLVAAFVAGAKPSGSEAVLCIGCRTGYELDVFRAHDMARVVGIDLFSERRDVAVMDMHDLQYPDCSFDVIFASHSLEHSLDPLRVVSEILRVARPRAWVVLEVPVGFTTSERELQDFGSSEGLLGLFGGHVGEVVLAQDLASRSPGNDEGSAVARVVFRLADPQRADDGTCREHWPWSTGRPNGAGPDR